MERACLCLPGMHDMYGGSVLKIGDNPLPIREFLDATLGFFGQTPSKLVERAE